MFTSLKNNYAASLCSFCIDISVNFHATKRDDLPFCKNRYFIKEHLKLYGCIKKVSLIFISELG